MGSGGFAPFKVKNRISATNAFAIAPGAHTLSTGVSNFLIRCVFWGGTLEKRGQDCVFKGGKRELEAGNCVIVFQFRKKMDKERGANKIGTKKKHMREPGLKGLGSES